MFPIHFGNVEIINIRAFRGIALVTKDLNIVTFPMFAPIKAHALIGASSVVIVASRNDAIKGQFLVRLAPRARAAEFRHE